MSAGRRKSVVWLGSIRETDVMSPSHAYDIASQWGSYVRAGDPGACFYSFQYGDGRPVSEGHRQDCLAYIDTLHKAGASDVDLLRLRAFLKTAPLAHV